MFFSWYTCKNVSCYGCWVISFIFTIHVMISTQKIVSQTPVKKWLVILLKLANYGYMSVFVWEITTTFCVSHRRTSRICAFYSSPTAITTCTHTHTHAQSHTSMSILLSIFHVQLLCYGNRRRLAMGWLLTADFRSFSLFSPAVLLLALNALLTHSCLLIPSQSLRGVHSMISVIIPCLLAPQPTVIPSVPPHFFVLPSSLPPYLF